MCELIFCSDYLSVSIANFENDIIYWFNIEHYIPSKDIKYSDIKKALIKTKSYLELNPDKIYGGGYTTLENKFMYDKLISKLNFEFYSFYLRGIPITIFSKQLTLSRRELKNRAYLIV